MVQDMNQWSSFPFCDRDVQPFADRPTNRRRTFPAPSLLTGSTLVVWLWTGFMTLSTPAGGALLLAREGRPQCTLVICDRATAAERNAAHELASHLEAITGARFPMVTNPARPPARAIWIGRSPWAERLFPDVPWERLGPDSYVHQTRGGHLLLAGGRPRGTLYAVYKFLEEHAGVRWWTPWATHIPRQPTLRVPTLQVEVHPVFEYREPFWYCAFDPIWKVRNGVNGAHPPIPADWGDCIRYKGFAHTFYALVPPQEHFAQRPEWFSWIQGRRTHERAQLCLSNPELRSFVVERVKTWLRESPEARIVSVTQNDWHGHCQCPNCRALDEAEGSPSGSLLDFINEVAARIEPEFPHVLVDTFAYQYTRRPPRTLRPRPNVVIRLCSIEANFREPLDHPSNAAFLEDLQGWAQKAPRLYVWDYTTDFANYLLPHPNWFTLGPNVRLFQRYGVRGVFEQGAYQDWGAEMAELRAWLLARLLWNPQQDDRRLIREFLEGYYGAAAGPIGQYLELMHKVSEGFELRCFTRAGAPHRRARVLLEAERLWTEAEMRVRDDPERRPRVRLAHLPVRYAFLLDWERLRREARDEGLSWPLPESRAEAAREFAAWAAGQPDQPWTRVRLLRESGLTVEQFLAPMLQGDPR